MGTNYYFFTKNKDAARMYFGETLELVDCPDTLDREQNSFLKNETFYGNELVATTFKLCLMNLYLHNIGDIYGNVPVAQGDSLLTDPGYRVDYVLTNPPFGKKSSLTFTNEEGEQEEEDLVYNRQDFWTTSSNKQLNFVQHINTILKATGKAAVVVPDNVLFEGGAGEIIRKKNCCRPVICTRSCAFPPASFINRV